jgi:hypothetical protein
MKPAWLKVAMGAGTVSTAIIGGLAGGPVVAVGAGLAALLGVLGALYHDKPKPRKAKPDKRGQVADSEEPG